MTEKKLTAAIEAAIRAEWPMAWVYKVLGGPYARAGVPDLLCCIEGRFVAIEVKVPSGHLTVRQEHEIECIKRAGGIAFVCRSVDELIRWLPAQIMAMNE